MSMGSSSWFRGLRLTLTAAADFLLQSVASDSTLCHHIFVTVDLDRTMGEPGTHLSLLRFWESRHATAEKGGDPVKIDSMNPTGMMVSHSGACFI